MKLKVISTLAFLSGVFQVNALQSEHYLPETYVNNKTHVNEVSHIERVGKIARDYARMQDIISEQGRVTVMVKLGDKGALKLESKSGLITRKASVDFTDNLSTIESFGLEPSRVIERYGIAVYTVNQTELDMLINSGIVESVVEDFELEPMLVESTEQIGATASKNIGYSGAGQTVVVIDSGFETSHPFINHRILTEACFSAGSESNEGLCLNNQNSQVGVGAASNCGLVGNGSCKHGTHVAGIAVGSNSEFSGVAPGANLVPIVVTSKRKSDNRVTIASSDIFAAMDWVLHDSGLQNVAAINLSLATSVRVGSFCDLTSTFRTLIQDLRSAGIATVAGTGNNGAINGIGHPACIPETIAVAATHEQYDLVAGFSNRNEAVDLLAPGNKIRSSVLNGGYQDAAGTSSASPHVAGAIAVIKSFRPHFTVDQVESYLENYGVMVVDTPTNLGQFWSNLTYPRVDIAATMGAIQPSLLPDSEPGPVTVSISGDSLTLRWSHVNDTTNYVREVTTELSPKNWRNAHEFDVGTNSVTYDNRTPGIRQYRIKACNDFGCSDWVESNITDESDFIPAKPNLAVSVNTNNFFANWSEVSLADRYEVQYRRNSGSWTGTATTYPPFTSTQFNNMSAGTYQFRARACNVQFCSDWDTSGSLNTSSPVPGAPASVNASISNGTDIHLSWLQVSGATYYEREVSTDGGAWRNPRTYTSTSVWFYNQTLTTYRYRIRACNDSGCSGWGYSSTITLPKPTAPASASASVSGKNITVSWSASTGVKNYQREVSTDGGAWRNNRSYSSSTTSVTFTNQTLDSYRYRIRACNNRGCSAWTYTSTVYL